MLPRVSKVARLGLLILSAFLVGGASAEAVRTHGAIPARAPSASSAPPASWSPSSYVTRAASSWRALGSAPAGKAAEVVLHEPGDPGTVRVAFRVEAVRDATGDIALAYALWVPGHDVKTSGTMQLTPGVEREIALADGALVARWLAVPVPSAALDAYLEGEAAQRQSSRRS